MYSFFKNEPVVRLLNFQHLYASDFQSEWDEDNASSFVYRGEQKIFSDVAVIRHLLNIQKLFLGI